MFVTMSRLTVAALLVALPAPAQESEQNPAEEAEAVKRVVLEHSGGTASPLEVGLGALEYAPENVILLNEAAAAALADGDADLALWFMGLALTRTGEDREWAALRESLEELIVQTTPEGVSAKALFDAYAEEVFDLGVSLYKSKLYLNAVDLFARCAGTRFESRAAEQLERVYDSKKAVAALLESGLDAPIAAPRKKTARWMAFQDPKHSDWDDAWKFPSDNYTITTNMGYALGEDMSHAMEQMNEYYRSVFGYKERGGTMARCKLYVYAHRTEFDDDNEDADLSPNVRGFFRPGVNEVRTYDPRTDPYPGTLSGLWSTLFHEASHQFTDATLSPDVPTWLNEGTASYFEGARLLPNGTVQTNLIPENRLRGLLRMIESGNPSLRDVISYNDRGSYPGAYYPVGWGLVYFFRNWENEDAERTYLPLYKDYMKSYKSGGVHDLEERFTEYFVEQAEVDGIESFADFEQHFLQWGRDLHARYYGLPSVADWHVARATRQSEAKQYDNALESYRRGLAKRPTDASAFFGLAGVLEKTKKKDAAILNYRRALEALRSRAPGSPVPGLEGSAEELIEICLKRISKLHRVLGARMTESDTGFVADAVAEADEYAGQGLPRTALQLLRDGLRVLPADARLTSAADAIRAASGVSIERWRRLPLREEFWDHDPERVQLEPGLIVAEVAASPRLATYTGELPDSYYLELTLHADQLSKGFALCALVFGPDSLGGSQMLRYDPKIGAVTIEQGVDMKLSMEQLIGTVPEEHRDLVTLGLARTPAGIEVYIQGKLAGKRPYAPGSLRGSIGLLLQNMRVEVTGLRVRW